MYTAVLRGREDRQVEQKRRRFNWFDGVVVLLVLGAAFLWFFVINRTEAVDETFAGNRAVYYVEVTNLLDHQTEQVQVGDTLQEGSQHLPIGRVVAVEIEPFELRVGDDYNQIISWQPVEERYTMVITVETQVDETPTAIMAEGEVVIRGGATLHFTGPGYAFSDAVILGWADRGE